MSEVRYLRLDKNGGPPLTPLPQCPILPWLKTPKTLRPWGHVCLKQDCCCRFDYRAYSPSYGNIDIAQPFFKLVSIDPLDPKCLIIRFFQNFNYAFITGRILLDYPATLEHILDAQMLFKEMEKVIHFNLYENYFEDRDTREREPRESLDKFGLRLKSLDANKSIDLVLSCTMHPDRKFTDSSQMPFRTQMVLDSLCSHIGHFLLDGNWYSSDAGGLHHSNTMDSPSPPAATSDYQGDVDDSSFTTSRSPPMLSSSSSSSSSSDIAYYDEIVTDRLDRHFDADSLAFYRTILHLLEMALNNSIR